MTLISAYLFWFNLDLQHHKCVELEWRERQVGARKLYVVNKTVKSLNLGFRHNLCLQLVNHTMKWSDIDIIMTLNLQYTWLIKALKNVVSLAQRARSSWVTTLNLNSVITQALEWPWHRYDLDNEMGGQENSCQV